MQKSSLIVETDICIICSWWFKTYVMCDSTSSIMANVGNTGNTLHPRSTQGQSPLGIKLFFNGNSSINLKVSMGTSSINGGLSIATFDYESVHHIWFPWSLFPTKTYSEKLKKQNSSMKQCLGPIMLYFIYSEHVFFEHLSSWMVAQSNNSPFSMTHTHMTDLQYQTNVCYIFLWHSSNTARFEKKYVFFSAFGGRINLLPGSSHPSFRPVGNLGDTGDSHLTLPVHLQVYLYIYTLCYLT